MRKHCLIYIIILSNWILTTFIKAETNVDSLKALLCDEKVIRQFNLRISVGDYYMVDSPAKAMIYYSEAQKIARYLKIDTLEARAFDNLGSSKLKTDDYLESENNFRSALVIYEKFGLQDKIAQVNYNLGLVDYYRGNYEQAVKNYQKALKIFKLRKDRQQEANTYQNIGLLFMKSDRLDLAAGYIQKSLNIYEELKEDEGIGISLSNLGLVYQKMRT